MIAPQTTISTVSLTISNLERSLAFYQERLGLQLHKRKGDRAWLGAGSDDLLLLVARPGATHHLRTTGLYHVALLLPTRPHLANTLHHLIETQTPLSGASDHLISEALYLSDPDGNGLEIAHDRPRHQWPWQANGELQLATQPLDWQNLLAERTKNPATPQLPPQTTIGHIHLHIANIPQATTFYHNILGFNIMSYYGPSALFVAAGDYHHHIGLNTWAGTNAPPPPKNSIGLRWFTINLPNQQALQTTIDRIQTHNIPITQTPIGWQLQDPSQNTLLLQVANQTAK